MERKREEERKQSQHRQNETPVHFAQTISFSPAFSDDEAWKSRVTVAAGAPMLGGGTSTVAGVPTVAVTGGVPTMAAGVPTVAGGVHTVAGGVPALAGGVPTTANGPATVAASVPTVLSFLPFSTVSGEPRRTAELSPWVFAPGNATLAYFNPHLPLGNATSFQPSFRDYQTLPLR